MTSSRKFKSPSWSFHLSTPPFFSPPDGRSQPPPLNFHILSFCTQYLGAVSISLYSQQGTSLDTQIFIVVYPIFAMCLTSVLLVNQEITKGDEFSTWTAMRYPKTSLADRGVSPVYSRWWILGSNICSCASCLIEICGCGSRRNSYLPQLSFFILQAVNLLP